MRLAPLVLFLGLVALPTDGDAQQQPAAAPAFKPEPRPAEDLTRLLTDAELALPRDSVVVAENPAYPPVYR